MLLLLLALAQLPPVKAEGRVSWEVAGDHIENCKVLKFTGDPKADARICAGVACANKMDVKTDKGALIPYRKKDCDGRTLQPPRK